MLRRKARSAEETREAALAREREQRRKKMLKTKYGQKSRRHARKGVQSCILAGVSTVLLLFMITISFYLKGEISLIAGFAGFAILWTAIVGLRYGIRGLHERDKNYITCKVGIGINGVILAGIAALFIRGLM